VAFIASRKARVLVTQRSLVWILVSCTLSLASASFGGLLVVGVRGCMRPQTYAASSAYGAAYSSA
jgi:hypothetical protein